MFEQIESNRRRSALIVGVMGALLVATGASLGALFAQDRGGLLLGGLVALIVWATMWFTAMSQGDRILLGMARAREIGKDDLPQLVNIVEEMTIAAGLRKPPRVFLVDDPAPNAFAAGRDPEHAAVAVTTGLLELLDRSELQGVVAHELAHIKNRDVSLITTAGIMLGSIVLLAEIGRRVIWYGGAFRRSRSGNDRGGHPALLIAAIVLMVLAPILAQLVYFSLSRRREYLADAAGAVFTRYPEGLASALEKLGGSTRPQENFSRVTAPMFIVRPLQDGERRSLSSAFATHPPLDDRIRILRSMGGKANLRAYESAYRSRHGGSGMIGKVSLANDADVMSVRPTFSVTETPAQRLRQASDALLSSSGYERTACRGCGATLKIPPSLRAKLTRCPRCKTPFRD
jgi:heat shock protein HtpX